MEIDPNKVNLAEADIESWLYENPEHIKLARGALMVKKWAARQLTVPSGRIDLLGVMAHGAPIVVEVKNVPIDSSALAQVCRYAADIEALLAHGDKPVFKLVIGKAPLDIRVQQEADAMNIYVLTFSVSLSLSLTSWLYTDEHYEKCNAIFDRVLQSGVLDVFMQDEPEQEAQETNEEIPDAFKDFLDGRESPPEE